MSVLEIIQVPNPLLRKDAKPVKDYNPDLKKLVADMADTMYAAPGVGLAANQVSVLKQVVVVDVSRKDEPKQLLVLINPEIVDAEDLEEMEEGCLSLPDFKQVIGRAGKVKVAAKNLQGEDIELFAEGLLARAIQHEVDHINGRLLLDYSNPIKRELYIKKRKKLLRGR
jgi:peptide deformylase